MARAFFTVAFGKATPATTEPVVQPFNRMDFPSKTCTVKAPCCHLPPSQAFDNVLDAVF